MCATATRPHGQGQTTPLAAARRYAHTKLTAFLTRTLPAGYEHLPGYRERGWPTCEASWVALAKESTSLSWQPIFDVGASEQYRRPLPMGPAALARLVASRRFTSKKADLPMVIALNTRTMVSLFGDLKEVEYMELDWGDEEVAQLCEVLPLCTRLISLNLCGNRIGDAGCRALAEACSRGAMPSLWEPVLGGNELGDAGVKALAEACVGGALKQLEYLGLHSNKIGDAGVKALADACSKGALPALCNILVFSNPASEAAQQAAKDAIKNRR